MRVVCESSKASRQTYVDNSARCESSHIGRFCLQNGDDPRLMFPVCAHPYEKVHENDDVGRFNSCWIGLSMPLGVRMHLWRASGNVNRAARQAHCFPMRFLMSFWGMLDGIVLDGIGITAKSV